MLDIGFRDDIRNILSRVNTERMRANVVEAAERV